MVVYVCRLNLSGLSQGRLTCCYEHGNWLCFLKRGEISSIADGLFACRERFSSFFFSFTCIFRPIPLHANYHGLKVPTCVTLEHFLPAGKVPSSRQLAAHRFLVRLFNPEDGGDKFLRKVGSHTDNTAHYPRRLQYSSSSYGKMNR